MKSVQVRDSTVWDSISWRIVRPLAWKIAGVRDRASTVRANRSRSIVKG